MNHYSLEELLRPFTPKLPIGCPKTLCNWSFVRAPGPCLCLAQAARAMCGRCTPARRQTSFRHAIHSQVFAALE